MYAVKITLGSEAIGRYGFAHWAGRPADPATHELQLVPQSIIDGWEGYCSCGEWKAFADFYTHRTRDEAIAAIQHAHAEHKET